MVWVGVLGGSSAEKEGGSNAGHRALADVDSRFVVVDSLIVPSTIIVDCTPQPYSSY